MKAVLDCGNAGVKGFGSSPLTPSCNFRSVLCLTVAAFVLAAVKLSAATHYVSLESTNPVPPYTNWATAATNIQEAVNAATSGDTVVVTNGVYVGTVVVQTPVTLQSMNGAQSTLIDGGFTNRCVSLADGASLTGFTLTNGWTADFGAGVWAASTRAFLTNCTLRNNEAFQSGGGAFGCTLYNCTIAGNWSETGMAGGAVGSTLYNCSLTANRPGGVGSCTLYNCTLSLHDSLGWGGGANNSTLYNCTLSQNQAAYGGAAYKSTLYNCTLANNSAPQGGGANQCTLYNCTLIGNYSRYMTNLPGGPWSGGGAFGCTLYNCTLSGNRADASGGGVSSCTLHNCIAYFNAAPNGANSGLNNTMNYCCTTPLPAAGVGNITNAPLLVNAAAGDFRLLPDSPCIDAGTNLMGMVSTDILGLPRPMDGDGDGFPRFDIGAYEFNPYRFAPTLQLKTEGFQLTVYGEPGKSVCIQRSRDLVNWEFAGQVPIPASGQTLIDPAATSEPRLFYRAVRVP